MSEVKAVAAEHRVRVLRGAEGSPVSLRVSGIQGDYNGNSFGLTVSPGDVQLEIEDRVKGTVVINFAPTSRNGRNPDVADKLTALAQELASLIELGKLK